MALTIADVEFKLGFLLYSGTLSEAILAGVTHILSPSC